MTALPAVPDSTEDTERLGLIAHVARKVQADVAGRALAPMTGGSALRLQYGLPRPSYDLDLDVSSAHRDWLSSVQRAVRRSPWGSKAEVTHKQGGRGTIRIVVRGAESTWQTKVDIKVEPGLTQADCLTSHDGLSTRTLRHIAQVKKRKLMGWGTERNQGRDLYDYAWLLANRPEAVPVKDRRQFFDWMLSLGDSEGWQRILKQDRALKGADPDRILDAALSALELDPGLRFADAQDGGAAGEAQWMGDGSVAIGCRLPGGSFVALSFHADPGSAAAFAEAHEIMHTKDVLAALRPPTPGTASKPKSGEF